MAKNITPDDSIVPIYQDSVPTNFEQEKQEFQENSQIFENQKTTAVSKLVALGLTESEAKIIIGIE